MNKQQFENALNQQLKGTLIPYNDYYGYQVCGKLLNIFENDLRPHQKHDLSVSKHSMNSYCLRYKSHYVCEIQFTRKKGETHYSYFNIHTDYYFNDFTITKDFDLDTRMKEIDDEILKQQEYQKNYDAKMSNIFKEIYSTYGEDTRSIVDYISRHYYMLKDSARKDNE